MTRARLVAGVGLVVGSRHAARMLGVDERTVVRWADDGHLPVAYRTPGGHRRFRVLDLEHYLNPQPKEPHT